MSSKTGMVTFLVMIFFLLALLLGAAASSMTDAPVIIIDGVVAEGFDARHY